MYMFHFLKNIFSFFFIKKYAFQLINAPILKTYFNQKRSFYLLVRKYTFERFAFDADYTFDFPVSVLRKNWKDYKESNRYFWFFFQSA